MKEVLPAFSPLVTDARYCHLGPLRDRIAGPSVTCAGDERCLPHYRVARPEFACWAMEFIAEGEGQVVLNGRKHRLRPGNVFIYGPGVSHVITTDPQRPMRKYFVDFFGRQARRCLTEAGLRPGELRRVTEADTMRYLFDELIREGRKPHERRQEATDGYLRLLLYKASEAPNEDSAGTSVAQATWRRCQQLIDQRFADLKGLDELSRTVRVHPSHLCRLFKRFGHDTPHTALTRRKMDHAATLLLTTSHLVKTIAAETGYEDPLHFSRVFRRHFGCSPRMFQKSEARPR